MSTQQDLFGDLPPSPRPSGALPAGFRYQEALIEEKEESELLAKLADLPFRAFDFHGHSGKRRVLSFGWRYDFSAERLQPAPAIPAFLLALRPRVAAFAGLEAEALEQVLITEYCPGAGIGWHRDKGVFDRTVGLSLRGPCLFRFRRRAAERWERARLPLAPRSVYLLDGPARAQWEHSIPAHEALRYSITFRNLRAP